MLRAFFAAHTNKQIERIAQRGAAAICQFVKNAATVSILFSLNVKNVLFALTCFTRAEKISHDLFRSFPLRVFAARVNFSLSVKTQSKQTTRVRQRNMASSPDVVDERASKELSNDTARVLASNDARQGKGDWMSKVKAGAVRVFHAVKWVALVVVFFLLLAIIASWNMNRKKTYSKEELQNIRSLVLYAAKSAEEAERIGRDDPLQALLHANYAVCYVNAAKHMVDEKTIAGLIGADIQEIEQYLNQLQQTLLSTVEYQILTPKAPVATVKEQGRRINVNPALVNGSSGNNSNSSNSVQRKGAAVLPPLPSGNKPSVFSS